MDGTKRMSRIIYILICLLLLCASCNGAERKEMNASEIVKLLKRGKPVQIVGKIILDDLDFTEASQPFIVTAGMLQTEIASNIFFSNCIFMGKVTANGLRERLPVHTSFKNNVVFSACDFRGEVDFNNAVVFGMFHFGQSVFREKAAFDNLTVWAKDSYLSEVQAERDFSMVYGAFSGNLYVLNAQFSGRFSMQETSVGGKISFNNSIFHEKAGFDLIRVERAAFFNYATFEKVADFSFAQFLHTTEFVGTKFNEKGVFEKTFFLNTVCFEDIDMEQDILLKEVYFGNNKNQ